MSWIIENLGTIVVSLLLAAAVCAALLNMNKRQKNGGSSCSCACSGCPLSGKCHKQP